MSSKSTWLWMTVAVVLFGFIFVFERYFQHPEPGPSYVLSELDTKGVKSIEIQQANQLGIRVERTNGSWELEEPIVYPAQGESVQKLLEAFRHLSIAHLIPEEELRKNPDAEENYGLEPPQILVVLRGSISTNRIYFGRRTAPGDQVFVRVIGGTDGISVVDADVLELFPPNVDAWRETALVDFARMRFDGITVTNASKNPTVQLERNPTNKLWAMAFPWKTRADNDKVQAALAGLNKLSVLKFLPEDPKADLDAFGLQSPELTIALTVGTNTLLSLDFGKEATNAPGLIYARRSDQNTIVVVSTNALAPWRSSYELFRDHYLVRLPGPLDSIKVTGRDSFTLEWQTNNSWKVMPEDYPADTTLTAGLVLSLAQLQIADFEKESVTKAALPQYGLATPARTYTLTWEDSPTSTNPPVELDFGTNTDGKVFAKRAGEDPVYGIAAADFEKLPDASWEMRDRRIWNFDVDDISRITIQENGTARQMIRNGTNGWSLPAGSQGSINDSAVESTARDLGHLTAFSWVSHGAQHLTNFGFTPQSDQISIELTNGEKREVQFGNRTRFGTPYATVKLNDEPWIFEFPPDLFSDVRYSMKTSSGP